MRNAGQVVLQGSPLTLSEVVDAEPDQRVGGQQLGLDGISAGVATQGAMAIELGQGVVHRVEELLEPGLGGSLDERLQALAPLAAG